MPAACPETSLPTPAPFAYTSEAELTESLHGKGTPVPPPGLYPRDGTEEVTAVEAAIAETTIPHQHLNVIVPAGMTAVSGAVQFAASLRGSELRAGKKGDERRPPTVAYARELYPQSTNSVMHLDNMGVITAPFESGEDMKSLQFKFGRGLPDVIFAETVANTPDMPVLQVLKLMRRAQAISESGSDLDPILVLDNTLPLKTGIDFDEILNPEDRVLVIESATKGRLHNSGHLGVVYSKNEKLMDGFRKFKITQGLVTSTHAEGPIMESLAATAPGFDDRNKALYSSTDAIAKALMRAQVELGADSDFFLRYPTLDGHPNQSYADRVLTNGVSPVVFLQPSQWGEDVSQKLLKRIGEHPAVVEQTKGGQIYFGQSFGFPEARMLYDPNASQMRISGGHNVDAEPLAEALYTAAVDI